MTLRSLRFHIRILLLTVARRLFIPGHPIVLLAAFQHIVWSALLWMQSATASITGIAAVSALVGVDAASFGFLAAGVLAALGVVLYTTIPWGWYVGLLIWQQIVLAMSATEAVLAAIRGSYPDGYEAPSLFILSDQMPGILLFVWHLIIMAVALFRRYERSTG